MTTWTCPNGHKTDSEHLPTCETCGYVAVWGNGNTGEAQWNSPAKYARARRAMQAAMDDADNNYFGDLG